MRRGLTPSSDQISLPEHLRLEFGGHDSPRDGVCIVELASILAGERFSDRPVCVDEVIAAFLRSWNDRLGHAERQRILPYAERIVDTAEGAETSRKRRDICLRWAGVATSGGRLRRALSRGAFRVKVAWYLGVGPALRLKQGAGEYAARLCFGRYGADEAFALLEELLDAGRPARRRDSGAQEQLAKLLAGVRTQAPRPNGNGNGHGNGDANGNGHAGNGSVPRRERVGV